MALDCTNYYLIGREICGEQWIYYYLWNIQPLLVITSFHGLLVVEVVICYSLSIYQFYEILK